MTIADLQDFAHAARFCALFTPRHLQALVFRAVLAIEAEAVAWVQALGDGR